MVEPNYDRLARAHMKQQVREAAVIQTALSRQFDALIDPNDVAASFKRFRAESLPLIEAGRVNSEATAQRFYWDLRDKAGLKGPGPSVMRQPAATTTTKAALARAADADWAARQIRMGANPDAVVAAMKTKVLGAAKKSTLDAGRTRLTTLSARDKDMRGWTRVGDGNPCGFCAMLVGRGPVYSAASVNFGAHRGCGCNARPVPRTDSSGGWSAEGRDMQALMLLGLGDIEAMRRMLHTRKQVAVTPIVARNAARAATLAASSLDELGAVVAAHFPSLTLYTFNPARFGSVAAAREALLRIAGL